MERVITDTRVSILWQALHEVSLKVSSPAARWNGNKIRNVQILGARQQENKIKLITSEPRGFYCIYSRFENVKTYVKRQIWERKKIRVPCKDRENIQSELRSLLYMISEMNLRASFFN